MKTLKENDIRQLGDEVRHRGPTDRSCLDHPNDSQGLWRPVFFIGHPILASDLIHLDFRRP